MKHVDTSIIRWSDPPANTPADRRQTFALTAIGAVGAAAALGILATRGEGGTYHTVDASAYPVRCELAHADDIRRPLGPHAAYDFPSFAIVLDERTGHVAPVAREALHPACLRAIAGGVLEDEILLVKE